MCPLRELIPGGFCFASNSVFKQT